MLNKLKKIKISLTLVVIAILILVLYCSFEIFFDLGGYKNLKTEKNNFYYYFTNNKIDFEGVLTINNKDKILSLDSTGLEFKSNPIYYSNIKNQIILPVNMEIVFPYKSNPMYKIGEFTKVYSLNDNIYVNSDAGNGRIYDCFLYDGEDLYVFIEDTTVIIGDDVYELSPMSFVEVTSNYIKIYNNKKDEFIFLEEYDGNVDAYTKEYFISLSNDTFTYNKNYYMLIKNIDRLNFFYFNN